MKKLSLNCEIFYNISGMIERPRLRGDALTCFTNHYFGTVIQTRLGSIGLRTRSNRRIAFTLLWRYLVNRLEKLFQKLPF
jgi:hypothetical protein